MCGRFALSIIPAIFYRTFGCEPPEGLIPRYNVTPDSQIVIVRAGEDGAPEAVFARWGLLGPWMKEANDPGRQINARSETAAEKPMFRDAFKRSRCLIPALGFYEWQKAGSGPSRPFFVGLASGEPFGFAGLWRRSRLADGTTTDTCTILTTEAHPSIRPIHHRMPVILPQAAHAAWLDPAVREPEVIAAILTPRPERELVAHEVGRAVSNPRNDGPSLIEPVGDKVAAPDPGPAQGTLL